MIALHARRSAESIARYRHAYPDRPLVVVLTGTDLYRDIGCDRDAWHSLHCASHLVVLQAEALERLGPAHRPKARVILQSAKRLVRADPARRTFDFVAVGHLREEKDPLTLMRAARELAGVSGVRVLHIGAALDRALGEEAQRTMRECSHYAWLGELPLSSTRLRMARSRALVHMSVMEGGANVVAEAIRSHVPVLASHIEGNIGLLGRDYDGYFPVGDVSALTRSMRRFIEEPAWAQHLQAQCALREPLFMPEAEAAALRTLTAELLGQPAGQPSYVIESGQR